MNITTTIIVLCLTVLICSCSQEESNLDNKNSTPPLLSVSELKTIAQPFKHNQPLTQAFEIHETLGSGLAAIDVDNDGNYEVFLAQFTENQSSSVLYKMGSSGKFEDITDTSGLADLSGVMGVAVADVNNDGWQDLLLYGIKQLHLMINHKGVFTELKLPKLPENSFYSSATFFNANDDGYLDLWLSRYVDYRMDKICNGNDGLRMYCAPSSYPFQSDFLLINNSGVSFSQAAESSINISASPTLGVVAADFNNDALQDIFIANDGENNFLFTQQNDGTFIEQAEVKSLGSNLAGLKEASMGIAIGDFDNNGLSDLFLTHLEQETNTLYKNEGKWFTDVTNQSKLGSNSRLRTGFGTGFYDLDGDNRQDLFVVNGRIQPIAYQGRNDLTQQFQEKPLLYLNQGATFKNVEIFNQVTMVGRGLIFVDLDNDGDKDMISNNNNQSPTQFTNNLNPTKWYGLNVKCHNRTDIGAKVQYVVNHAEKEQKFYKTIHTDGSYASASDPRIIIYLNGEDTLINTQIEFSNKTRLEISKKLINNNYVTVNCVDRHSH